MNTNELHSILASIGKRRNAQVDVIPCDLLHNYRIKRYPFCLIVNSDESTKPGSHWVSIFILNKTKPCEFYCSYGRGVAHYGRYFTNFVMKHGRGVVDVPRRLQAYGSDVCGQYSIYFLRCRLKNLSIKQAYDAFGNDYDKNDLFVRNFVNELMKYKCINCNLYSSDLTMKCTIFEM